MGLDAMLEAHRSRGAAATVGSWPILEAAWDKERIELDAENGVKAIHRLHPMQEKRSLHRPAGLYLFEPAILQLLPSDSYFDLKEQLFPDPHERGLPRAFGDPTILPHDFQYRRLFFANLDVLTQRVQFRGSMPLSRPDRTGG
jgi:NDP-sugar pyrophosphorylase family protein